MEPPEEFLIYNGHLLIIFLEWTALDPCGCTLSSSKQWSMLGGCEESDLGLWDTSCIETSLQQRSGVGQNCKCILKWAGGLELDGHLLLIKLEEVSL